MKNLFPGLYKPTDEEFGKLWREFIFAFDTNILLNIYRYSEKTRYRLFYEILDLLKDRIWIPYQVAYEYQEERLNVISKQLEPYSTIQKVLDENLDKLDSVINDYRKRHSFTSLVDENKIIKTIDNKEDWWKRHKGQTISPRPELIQEIKTEANVAFWMYTGDRFLSYAEKYLKLQGNPKVIEEAKEIRLEKPSKQEYLLEEYLCTYGELKKALEKTGFEVFRQRGSHLIMKHEDNRVVTIAMKRGTVRKNILLGILRKAELTIEDFIGLL